MDHVYDIGFIIKVIIGFLIISGIMSLLYGLSALIRYGIAVVYALMIIYLGYRNRAMILGIFKKRKAKTE